MSQLIPEYIKQANINTNIIGYKWDSWNEEQAEEQIDQVMLSRLSGLSQRAVLAFMCCTAEWIVYRFENLCNDSAPMDFVEASWAMIIDLRYCGYGSTTWQVYADDGWVDPIKGPIRRALDRLEIAFQQLAWQGTDPVYRAGYLAAIAAYVMPDPDPFNAWCLQAISQLESHYRRDPEDELGDVVPRQALAPRSDFKLEQTETFVNSSLKCLNYRSNIFLSPPDGMLEPFAEDEVDGFKGTPYIFRLEEDRKFRLRNRTSYSIYLYSSL